MTYLLHLGVMICIYAMLAVAANFVIGYGGLLTLSMAAFYGLGAYLFAGLSVSAGLPFLAALPAAVLLGAVAGLLLSALLLRFRGEAFAVATMAVQMVAFGVFYNWTDVTGGPYGFPDIPRPELFGFALESTGSYFVLSFSAAAAAVVLAWAFSRTRRALCLRALRDDETAAAALGLSPRRLFSFALVLSAAMAAASGALFAGYVSYVDPTGFSIAESVLVLAMLVVGGSGNVHGPIAGAVILVLLPEALRFVGIPDDVVGPAREMAYGFLLIVFMYAKPKGVAGDYAIR